ncbi:MAG TPA: hypothetical protein VJT72_19630 [Pseudonocardiaceae bacterium]|nr:hypothetical protein [Pseudonocardiaceae bacterium]
MSRPPSYADPAVHATTHGRQCGPQLRLHLTGQRHEILTLGQRSVPGVHPEGDRQVTRHPVEPPVCTAHRQAHVAQLAFQGVQQWLLVGRHPGQQGFRLVGHRHQPATQRLGQ